MTTGQIIKNIICGGLLGSLGQGIRIAIGFKKFNEENAAKALQGKPTEAFSISRMVISIFIGFVAGALGMIVKGGDDDKHDNAFVLTIIAIGYSGADFIEGLFNTYINKLPAPVAPPTIETGSHNEQQKDQPLLVTDESALPPTPSQG